MIEMTIVMKLKPQKRKELLITLRHMLLSIRKLDGCSACHACFDIENRLGLNLTIVWDSQEDLKHQLQSKLFGALVGAIQLLCKSHEITIKGVLYSENLDTFLENPGSDGFQFESDFLKGRN